ncbi:phosphoribosylglycinamide formyltransferase [Alloiococcus sp. CFN-8]|uniref:phosphoribosylglycinamide formyltransferase n=1 Tax=Alloiococcus sp. CFN-8 TaxID=3416081 RepID=UPI003CE749F9
MYRIAVFVSGSGSNLQSILDAVDKGELKVVVTSVISDNPKAEALKRAEAKNIPTFIIEKGKDRNAFGDKALELIGDNLDLIVLAGFLSILSGNILKVYKNKIINIHPSLIPKYCGKGMYGIRVHEAVLKGKEEVSGCTVHVVNEVIDGGDIILQKTVQVKHSDTPESLQKRVLIEEHKALVQVIAMLAQEDINEN